MVKNYDSYNTLNVIRKGNNPEGSILLVYLNRPRVKNAFSDEMYNELQALLNASSIDDTVNAVVLTGTGEYFSSGADLKNTNMMPDNDETTQPTFMKPAGRFMVAMLQFPKLICAAVNGPAVGIGVTLLLHCDLCFCTKNATFWTPFTRIALVPEFCSSETFVATMGQAKANELLILGRKINAETAVDWNICSRIILEHEENEKPLVGSRTIGDKVCSMIDLELFSLSSGSNTSKKSIKSHVSFATLRHTFFLYEQIFIEMLRKKRQKRYEELCEKELKRLDDRIDAGEPLEATIQLSLLKQKSKL